MANYKGTQFYIVTSSGKRVPIAKSQGKKFKAMTEEAHNADSQHYLKTCDATAPGSSPCVSQVFTFEEEKKGRKA